MGYSHVLGSTITKAERQQRSAEAAQRQRAQAAEAAQLADDARRETVNRLQAMEAE